MKKTKYIAGLITILGTAWLNAQINPTNNVVGGTNSSVAGGSFNRCVAIDAIIGAGLFNTNTAFRGTIGGGLRNRAETDHSTIPGGCRAQTRSHGQMAYASGSFTGLPGEAQFALYVLRGITVGNETEELHLGGNEQILVTTNASYLFDIDIVTRAVDQADPPTNPWYGNFFHYKIAVENRNGALAWDFLPNSTFLTNYNPSVMATVTNSNDRFIIKGTGKADETIHWVATVRATELVKP